MFFLFIGIIHHPVVNIPSLPMNSNFSQSLLVPDRSQGGTSCGEVAKFALKNLVKSMLCGGYYIYIYIYNFICIYIYIQLQM